MFENQEKDYKLNKEASRPEDGEASVYLVSPSSQALIFKFKLKSGECNTRIINTINAYI